MAQIQPNCFECKYHFITHQPKRPYGCRRFGFKGLSFRPEWFSRKLA